SELRPGTPAAAGIASCLLEDASDQVAILEGAETETKIAMLACARLLRLPLPVDKVAANLNTPLAVLSVAGERYLEAEDSPEARAIILSRHPGEAKILGATTAFTVEGAADAESGYLFALY